MPCLKDMKKKFIIYEINVLLAEMGFFSKLKKKKIKFHTKFINDNQQSRIENFDTNENIVDLKFDVTKNVDKLIEKYEQKSQNKEFDSILKTRQELPFKEIIEIRDQEIKRPETPHFSTELNSDGFYGELDNKKELFDIEIPNDITLKNENKSKIDYNVNKLFVNGDKKPQKSFMDLGRIKFWNKSSNQNQAEPKKVQGQMDDFTKTKIGLEKTKRDIQEQEKTLEYVKNLENQKKDELKREEERKKKEEKLKKLEIKKKIKEAKLRKLQADKAKKQVEREEKRLEKQKLKKEKLKEKELKKLELNKLNAEKLKKRETERLEKQKIKEFQKIEEEKQKEILLKEKQKQEQLRLKQLEEEKIEKQKIKELQKIEEEKQKELLLKEKQKEEELRLKKLEEEKIEKQKEMLLRERQKEEELKSKGLEKEIQGEIKSDEPPEMGKFIQKETVTKNENPYLDADVEKLLPIIDQLLEKLPDDVVDEFAQSDNFALYEKVVNKYKRK